MNRWDTFFKDIVDRVAKQSLCLNKQFGAVLVVDKRIIATGYNGPPEGIPACAQRLETDPAYAALFNEKGAAWNFTTCPRYAIGMGHGEGREMCPAAHAEANAIVNAAREGISCKGATMYVNKYIPCKNCLSLIMNSGVKEIVVETWQTHNEIVPWMLLFSKLKIRNYR